MSVGREVNDCESKALNELFIIRAHEQLVLSNQPVGRFSLDGSGVTQKNRIRDCIKNSQDAAGAFLWQNAALVG